MSEKIPMNNAMLHSSVFPCNMFNKKREFLSRDKIRLLK